MTSRVWKTLLAGGVMSAMIGVATLVTVDRQPAHADPAKHPVVLELFTSQGCYSCPAAEAFLGELIDERSDIIALEWHVDYWDKLVHGGSSWKDPFSDASFTERQQTYASQLQGRGYGYTPQMVIDGKREAVGSNRGDVLAAMKASAGEPKLVVTATTDRAGTVAISVDGTEEGSAAIWVVTYLKSHVTEVIGGENKGKTLANHNIVRAVERVGQWDGDTVTVNASILLDPNQGCVVLVQADRQGPVLGAARCTSESSTDS